MPWLHRQLRPLGAEKAPLTSSTDTRFYKRVPARRAGECRHNIAIIGSSGFIGSRLHVELAQLGAKERVCVTGFDRVPLDIGLEVVNMTSAAIPTEALLAFDSVVYLGGLTGRVVCDAYPNRVQFENVDDIVALAKRMEHRQTLVFASTSALLEGYGGNAQDEKAEIKTVLLDGYAASLQRREIALRALAKSAPDTTPRLVGTRFGTVVGVSPSQRTDMLHMALVRNAFMNARLRLTHPETYRAMVWIDDLARALATILLTPAAKVKVSTGRFEVFHLTSFQNNIAGAANEVAAFMGIPVDAVSHDPKPDNLGFSLLAGKFLNAYPSFAYEGTPRKVVKALMAHGHHVVMGRELAQRTGRESIPCVVCGSKDLMTVLDLKTQPLANDFRKTPADAEQCERYPLKLMRCRKCQHSQLSYVVDRGHLFSKYLYRSGTSSTLANYFVWLANKIDNERLSPPARLAMSLKPRKPSVVEIACNDGTQLDKFSAIGWRTYGVDPAANIVELARAKGHNVFVAFWGQEDVAGLPEPDDLDAIVAQNVLAHTDHPREFLQACAKIMGARTKAYMQTSQCEMYGTGQFDTVYHEHVSFFTAHSFRHLAEQSGLRIVNMEITPIHGNSCLVTLMRAETGSGSHEAALVNAIENERSMGMDKDWFYLQYRGQAQAMGRWMHRQLNALHAQKYEIAAYGAAAKGIVLLHFLRLFPERTYEFSFVIDDADLKQNTYCPGTSIPVKPTSALSSRAPGPLVIVVFAWNFLAEIKNRILDALPSDTAFPVLIMVPYPHQQLISVDISSRRMSVLMTNPFVPPQLPSGTPPTSTQVALVTSFRNAATLLPRWIRHHAPLFDRVVLVDMGSTDGSREVLRREAPSTWEVRESGETVQRILAELPHDMWKVTLTACTDYLVFPQMHETLGAHKATRNQVGVRVLTMNGANLSLLKQYESLLLQRSQYRISERKPLVIYRRDSGQSAESSDVFFETKGFVGSFTERQAGGITYDLASVYIKPERAKSPFHGYHAVWQSVFQGVSLFKDE